MARGTAMATPKIVLSDSFYPLLEDKHRYLVLCGGRGSGKSEFAARKIFFRCQAEGGHRFLILRKVRKTAKESVLEVVRRLLTEQGIEFEYNKTDRIISWGGNELLFDGLDEPEKIKSIKGLTGVWVEETTEFTEHDFLQVDLAFREPGPTYKQIILTFNPEEALARWLKRRFFDNTDPDAYVHNSTVEDNPIAEIREEYRKQLDAIQDATLKDIYRYGMWGAPKGVIYSWDVVPEPGITSSGERVGWDEIFYGGDFGYTVNPATLIRIYRKGNEFWLEEVFYKRGMTNQDIADEMKADKSIDPRAPSYWDSAEEKSIEEIHRAGINAKPADKGPGSVRAGIMYCKAQTIHIVAGSMNLIREASSYKWREDKHGDPLPEPEKFDDHGMDATRYGIVTHTQKSLPGFIGISKEAAY